jgi:UDPglucose--hexose-1-phosphate uridylyltransferase
VIYAPARGDRPHDFTGEETGSAAGRTAHDPSCPFCPGNEDRLPAILTEKPAGNSAGWQTRVIPNKFPVLSDEAADVGRQTDRLFIKSAAQGRHEVIIESPRHDGDLARMDTGEAEAVIATYHERYRALLDLPGTRQVVLFRNHGARAGTSLRHPHAQIVATPMVPAHTRQRASLAEHYHHRYGSDLIGDLAAGERSAAVRMVGSNRSFAAFVPFAAEVPFEMWIVPYADGADFGAATAVQQSDLAQLLRDLLARFSAVLGDPDYNLIFHSAPRHQRTAPYLRWYMRIRPRMTTRAGFELGTGIRVNPSLPEDNAALIRGDTSA